MINRRQKAMNAEPEVTAVPFELCPAKTYKDLQGVPHLGRSVFNHCQIVGQTAKALLERMPATIRHSLFPPGSALQAALHDIGKVSPVFFLKLQCAVEGEHSSWLQRIPQFRAIQERDWGGHAGVSELALAAMTSNPFVPRVAGQHHGFNPPEVMLTASAEPLGGTPWQAERCRLVAALQQVMGEEIPTITTPEQARVLAGLSTVADWIGSGHHFEDPAIPWQPRIEQALDEAGFVLPRVRKGLAFGDIFRAENGAPYQPNESQQLLHQHSQGVGVYVLEAPMGIGKTEAALYAAYKMLEEGKATGIYFALPTQLTSNKLVDRFNDYLKQILTAESPHRHSLLLHGSAWLVNQSLGEEGKPGRSWFDSAKRGLLAPFAVGTLDQALMAAMNVKHGFVRAFGLTGKVVILDEVHSYDAYTGVILDELIRLLRHLHCTVIILSATLSQARRSELLGQPTQQDAYPLISVSTGITPSPLQELPVTPEESCTVHLQCKSMADQTVLEEALRRAAQGQQVLWIENTVAEARERYFDLAARAQELGVACGLLHSRFTALHRQKNEAYWVGCYGKAGRSARGKQGRILIGTQVLEQSLDIDADFLVSRMAPTDMLFQRLGRLWRHEQTPRPPNTRREAWILAPELDTARQDPYQAFGATAHVYAPYLLCRSLAVWLTQVEEGHVSLPGHIRPLVERTYQERDDDDAMARWKRELFEGSHRRKGVNTLRQLARLTLSKGGKTLSEAKAQTRYSEQESGDLLLLSGLYLDDHNQTTTLTFLDGEQVVIPWHAHHLAPGEWRRRAAQVTLHLVSCRLSQLPRPPTRLWCQQIGLGNVLYLGHPDQDDATISITLVDADHQLHAIDGCALPLSDRLSYRYRDDIGLTMTKYKE
ncbi:CRISPR-associated helicase Cas3' [Edwardsiella tarda]|uniref:CRISPR-associated helicase Cas3' n=1 Tax=Edwardsiella tarda TaxID=636 RepID=UPI000D50B46F|nr:CRISPR-associated helicase Cas3' [Edwardsiella tarda]UCQ26608.1 CRISPR-associated helicase Cas3' [Edwardsiella tarda]